MSEDKTRKTVKEIKEAERNWLTDLKNAVPQIKKEGILTEEEVSGLLEGIDQYRETMEIPED